MGAPRPHRRQVKRLPLRQSAAATDVVSDTLIKDRASVRSVEMIKMMGDANGE